MRIFISLIIISLTAGCSGLADAIRKGEQKRQAYKQHAFKYQAACQKEAFDYYPVVIVEKEKPKSLYKPQTTVTCNTFGSTTTCRDTTVDWSEIIEWEIDGTQRTYDANANSRKNHINSCINNNLRSDSSYRKAMSRIEYSSAGYVDTSRKANYSTDYSKYNSIQSKAFKSNTDNSKGYKLNGYDVKPHGFKCYYGRNGQYNIDIETLPCPARLQ